MKNKIAISLTTMLILATGSLLRVQAKENNNKGADNVMVVTATGFSQQQVDAPATISVIDHNTLDLHPNQSVADAIKDIPGVAVGNGASDVPSGDIMIRGMDSSYTALMVDGIKQNTSESRPYGQDIGAEVGFLPPMSVIDHIEVIRGPMSSLYGSDAIGGVVNIITKKPYRVPRWKTAVAANTFLQEHHIFGNTSQINAFVMGPIIPDMLGVSISADWMDRRDDRRDMYFSKHNRKSIDMTLGLVASENNLFDLNVSSAEQRKTHNITYNTAWLWKFDRDAVTLTHNGYYAGDKINTTNYINYEKGRSTYWFSGLIPQHIKTENYVINSQTTFNLDPHKLSVGVNFTREALDDRFDVASKKAPGVEPVTNISRNGWAFFVEDGWEIGDFTLTSSARVDRDNYFGTHVTPKLYGNWLLNNVWSIKGGVSTGYKKPELRSTSADFVTPHGSRPPYPFLTIGNKDLKPEKSVNSEIGVYMEREFFSMDGTLFYTWFNDKIDEQTICETDSSHQCEFKGYKASSGYKADSISKYFNVSKASVYGVELNASWQIMPALKANVNYTISHSEQQDGVNKGYALNDFPLQMGNVYITWSATPSLDLWSKINYRGRNRDSGYHNKYEASTMIDLGARYRLNKNIQFLAGIDNLLDADPHRISTWGEYGLVEGRRYNLGTRVEF